MATSGWRSIDALIARMQELSRPLAAAGDRRRFFHDTYLRTTLAVKDELARGGFVDPDWTQAWDVRFAELYLEAGCVFAQLEMFGHHGPAGGGVRHFAFVAVNANVSRQPGFQTAWPPPSTPGTPDTRLPP